MARVRESDGTARISTSFPYVGVKVIPELNLPALQREHSAGSGSVASTNSASPSETLRIPGIPLHEPCFVTKRPGYSLEKAHLVNAARNDKPLKEAVELFLKLCGVVPLTFKLNSPSNLIPLDRTLHYMLDRLGFIAITGSKETLDAMLTIVKEENAKYDQPRGGYLRSLGLYKSAAPFSNAKYEMVVLHPDHFLPTGSGIVMHTQDPVDPSHLAPKLYMVGSDGALREGRAPTSARFPMFSASDMRDNEYGVNPLLVITNAAIAFRRFRRLGIGIQQSLCAEYAELIDATIKLADAIYHPPMAKAAVASYNTLYPNQSGGGPSDEDDVDTTDDPPHSVASVTHNDKEKTLTLTERREGSTGGASRKRAAMKFSRFGKEISHPGPNASDEEIRDFCYYILSGRDHPLTSQDEAVLKSIGLYSDDDDDEDSAEAEDNNSAARRESSEHDPVACLGAFDDLPRRPLPSDLLTAFPTTAAQHGSTPRCTQTVGTDNRWRSPNSNRQ